MRLIWVGLLVIAICGGSCVHRPDHRAETQGAIYDGLVRAPEAASDASAATLAAYIDLALAQSETVGIAGERAVQAGFAGDGVRAASLPELRLEGTHEQRKDVGGGGGAGGAGGGFGSFLEPTNNEVKLRFETPLYSGLKNRSAAAAADAWQASRLASLKNVRDQVALAVTEAYLEVLDADRREATLTSQLRLLDAQIEQVSLRREAGDARESELLLRQAQAAETQAALVAASEDGAVARESLAFLIGRNPTQQLTDPAIPAPVSLALEDLRAAALANRHDLAALQAAVTAREQELETVRRGRLPEVSANADYYFVREGVSEDVDWVVSLEAAWILADSGRRRAATGEAESRIQEAILSHRELLRRVDLDIRRLLAEIRGVNARTQALADVLLYADAAHAQATDEYNAGSGQNLEILAAEDQRLRAQLELQRQALRMQLLSAQLQTTCGNFPVETQP